MRDARIGRILVASLHQAIADIMPTRLDFYENWLSVGGLRDGTIGLAPMYAVLSFLRQEGDVYAAITTRAGTYAAEWTIESLPAARRTMIRVAPRWLRSRMLIGVARGIVRSSYRDSRAIARVRRGTARIDLRASIFCSVREPVPQPLCWFYVAAVTRLMELFGIDADAEVVACRARGEATCIVEVALGRPPAHAAAIGS